MSIATVEQVTQESNWNHDCQTRPPRILCIDDDPNLIRSLQRRFKRHGVELLTAADGREGYQMALKTQPDVILTDMRMPCGNGCWLLSRLKATRETVRIPVLVLTGLVDQNSDWLATQLGAERILEKPIRFRNLLDHLQPYLPNLSK